MDGKNVAEVGLGASLELLGDLREARRQVWDALREPRRCNRAYGHWLGVREVGI